jgi:hypothetical protein
MKHTLVEQDLADWQPMLAWLKAKEGAWRETAQQMPGSLSG